MVMTTQARSLSTKVACGCTEYIDVNALHGLLQHDGVCVETKADLKSIKKRLVNGCMLPVTYGWSNAGQFGRVYAVGPSMQGMDKRERAALVGNLVWDIDIANCHPTLLCGLCDRHGLTCTFLDFLVKNRSRVLNAIMQSSSHMDRDDAKKVILKILYLGDVPTEGSSSFDDSLFDNHGNVVSLCQTVDVASEKMEDHCVLPGGGGIDDYLVGLKAEIAQIAKNLGNEYQEMAKVAMDKRRAKNKTWGDELASVLSMITSHEEHKVLMAIVSALRDHERVVTTLIFDGCHVLRLEGEKTFPEPLLRTCEDPPEAVQRETGHAIRLEVKQMTHTFDFTPKQKGGMPSEKKVTDFMLCRDVILQHAKENKLVRVNGQVLTNLGAHSWNLVWL